MTPDARAIARGLFACLAVLASGHAMVWALRSYPPDATGRSAAPMATPIASRPCAFVRPRSTTHDPKIGRAHV